MPPDATDGTPWFPALAEPQVRLYLIGQTLSMLGTWVLDITLNLLAWQLSATPLLLGLLNFLLYGPGVVVTPLFSARLTAANARRSTLWVLMAALLVALLLTVLLALHWLTLPLILVIAAARGVLNGMEVPSRQMLLVCSIEQPERIGGAVALNTVAYHAARMCGPAIAAALFSTFGAQPGFAFAAVALVLMLSCVSRLRSGQAAGVSVSAAAGRGGLGGALDFVRGDRVGRLFLPVMACVGLFAGGFQTLVPVLADRQFGDTARWTAGFYAAAGVGSLAAALALATRHMSWGLRRLLVSMPWLITLALAGLGWARHPVPAMLCFAALGFGMAFVGTGIHAMLLQRGPVEARGGLIALLLMTFTAAIPAAQLLAGLLAQWLPIQQSFFVLAAVLAVSLALLFVPRWWALGRLELDAERV